MEGFFCVPASIMQPVGLGCTYMQITLPIFAPVPC